MSSAWWTCSGCNSDNVKEYSTCLVCDGPRPLPSSSSSGNNERGRQSVYNSARSPNRSTHSTTMDPIDEHLASRGLLSTSSRADSVGLSSSPARFGGSSSSAAYHHQLSPSRGSMLHQQQRNGGEPLRSPSLFQQQQQQSSEQHQRSASRRQEIVDYASESPERFREAASSLLEHNEPNSAHLVMRNMEELLAAKYPLPHRRPHDENHQGSNQHQEYSFSSPNVEENGASSMSRRREFDTAAAASSPYRSASRQQFQSERRVQSNDPPVETEQDILRSWTEKSEREAAAKKHAAAAEDEAIERLLISRADLISDLHNSQTKCRQLQMELSVSNQTIVEMKSTMEQALSRISVPNIVLDEFRLRLDTAMEQRNAALSMLGACQREYHAYRTAVEEEKRCVTDATNAALAKTTAVRTLRERNDSLEDQLREVQGQLTEKKLVCQRLAEELAETRAQASLNEVINGAEQRRLVQQAALYRAEAEHRQNRLHDH